MPLSEREQRLLKELEQQLQSDDPGFASSLEDSTVGGAFNVRNLVLGLLVTVVGVGVLIAGIYQQWIPLGIVGFLIMGLGVYFATAGGPIGPKRGNGGGNGDGGGGSGGSGPRSSTPSPSGGNFMSTLEQKWEERRRP
ncbi:DUF3040 domain-containing protein [Nesterenkonia sphaerica]|uniref:DUF3040 domain-containing protein n=1 Tax=Nesterenkonia sphaerica TaxID=1804988 RepID=A0A5R9AFP2_9MICC|nr:DUF3040 domain-containing protein [Nesterenkonia sphaerica]TLP77398.1 DUF3040 domain-containing protein [Nesterenkonia sphaerica]